MRKSLYEKLTTAFSDWRHDKYDPELADALERAILLYLRGKPPRRRNTLHDRIVVQRGHWLWTGARESDGRPLLIRDGKRLSVARYLYEAQYGPLGDRRLYRLCNEADCVYVLHHSPSRPNFSPD